MMAENVGVDQGMPARERHYPIDTRHIDIEAAVNQAQTEMGGVAANNLRETDQLEVDVFFSHSSKDKEWVHETASRLEAEQGLVCSYDEKDFIGGKNITKNILNCIKKSRKTVLVITPDFLASRWCEYEIQVVFREHLFRKGSVAVPVLLKNCLIPDFIAHVTYLEVEDPQFWEKFVEILKSRNEEDAYFHEGFGNEESKFNGKSLAEVNTSYYCCPGFDYAAFHDVLNSKGIRVNHDECEEIRQLAIRSHLHMCYCCYICHQSLITLGCSVLLGILCLVLAIIAIISYVPYDYDDFTMTTLFLIAMGALLLAFIITMSSLRVKRITRKAEIALNLHLTDHKFILGLVRKHRLTGKQALHFLYFNKSQCLGFLKRRLTAKKESKAGHVIKDNEGDAVHEESVNATAALIGDRDEDEQEAENAARRDMAEICGAYIRDASEDKLRNPRLGQRHTIKGQGMCLCQFVQAKKYDELV